MKKQNVQKYSCAGGAVLLMFAVLLASCASKKHSGDRIVVEYIEDVPAFFFNPPQSDTLIYGAGFAKMAHINVSRNMALFRARNDIMFQVQAQVQAAVSDSAQESGAGSSQLLSFSESVSSRIADITLRNAKTEQIVRGKDSTVYALLSVPKNNVIQSAQHVFARNESDALIEFKAQEVLKFLEERLKDMASSTPSPPLQFE